MNKTNVFGVVQNSASSSSRISNFTKRLAVLTLLLLTVVLGTRAASYTISSGNNYLGINNGAIANINPFNASTCVWTGPESGTGKFSMTVNDRTYYLQRANSGSLTVTTSQNDATNWTINGEKLYYRQNNNNFYYINYSNSYYNSGWNIQNGNGSGTLEKFSFKDPTGITAEGVEILVGEEGQITYELDPKNDASVYDNVTFSINNENIATINATTGVVTGVSAGTATVTVTAKKQNGTTACTATCNVVVKEPIPTQYVFYYSSNYGAYYLAVNDARNGVTSTQNFNAETCIWTGVDVGAGLYSATVDGMTYYLRLQSSGYNNYTLTITTEKNEATQWTINDAKLYSNGRYVRYNSGWITTGTPTNSGTDVLYPITKISEGTPTTTVEYTVGNTTVSPTAAAVDYGKTQQFTANASVTKTTTTTKTDTYQHSSSTGNTIQPKTSVSSTSSETLSPTGYDWSLSSTENLTLGSGTASTSSVTYSTASGTTKNVTLNVTAYYMDGASKKQGAAGTATITVNEKKDDPIGISAQPLTLAVDEQKSISYTLTPSNAYDNIAYSGNYNGIISIDANGVVTGLKAGITEVTLTAKNQNGTNSEHSATSTVTVTPKAPTIEFALGANNTATISTTETGATICYTTDGTTPTISSSVYTAPVSVTAGATVKAIVVVKTNGAQLTSPVAEALAMAESGVIGGTVFLYDLEDHNWTYYSGVAESVDGGNYNTKYAGKLYSPNPRNVKITYNGVNGISGSNTNVRVSISENENSFVYYKTLEQGSTQGEYPYTVISNPFSVRPSTGSNNSKVYYGFAGWKIISGGEYIKGYNNGQILPLDAEIVFENLPYNSVNCISAEIVLETSWAQANVQIGNNITTMMNNFTGGTYETNFAVLTGTYTTQWTGNKNATITSIYPDGSIDSRNNVSTRLNLTLNSGCTIKYEYIHINNNETTFSMGSGTKTLYLGRGISNTSANGVCCNLIQGYGNSISSGGLTYTIKIESGIYNYLSFIKGYDGESTGNTVAGTVAVKGVLGCDYDRAKKNNSNLKIQNHAIMGYANQNVVLLRSPKAGDEVLNVTLKSGSLNSNTTSAGTADVSQSFYIGIGGGYSPGYRVFTMEGGEMWSLAAGICQNTAETNSIRFRIKGGLIKGSIYGSAANANSYGYKQMILTGGHVKGWIAGGGNGTSSNGGVTTGSTYIYVGGNCRVDSEGSNTKINSSLGGQVFGSGSGIDGTTNWGQMLYGTNVVVADNAYIERNVFGGGNFGWTEETANIYLTGDKMSVGGVYGGANQNKGDNVQVFMTGGTVRDGLYGGSNVEGVVGGNVTMQINGGQVGTLSNPANIHGGGYGNSTTVRGNVNMTIGESISANDWVKVYGNVYGGSALGTVGGNAAITMNKGEINGNLFGGALGNDTYAAQVNGNVVVTVNGGKVTGAVFGCNDANGTPKGTVSVTVNGTDATTLDGSGNKVYALQGVYGGGNLAHYNPTTATNGYPKVVVNNCLTSIKDVYGGGNAAAVPQTDVAIYGGDIGRVFAGGNGISGTPANVGYQNKLEPTTANSYGNGTAIAKIYGGTIGQVFGGSNAHGVIRNNVSVTIDKSQSTANPKCDMIVGEVYGGGNMAESKAASVIIGCTGTLTESHSTHSESIGVSLEGIGSVFGGANQANVTGDITVNINSGIVANVFGGNNQTGAISGSIKVNIEKTSESEDCGWYVGNVFGGGNLAQYSGDPAVNILNGEVSGNVYGGGKGDANDHSKGQVTGNPTVTIGDKSNAGYEAIVKGDVYGGGDAGNVVGTPVVNVVNKCNSNIGNVYGGGNAADVEGTDVNIDGGTITGMVFGGGHGDKNADPQTEANVNGNVNVDITGGTINKVFGGSNSKGNITGTIALNIEKGDESCELHITEVYGGGNEAAGNAGVITIGCTGSEIEGIDDVYGGANAADINTGITLNITGGNIKRVFGGNNTSGSINGDIQVNVDWSGTCGVNALGNVYGAGNQAAYSGNTEVNILNGTVTGSVYGGGLGATAVVTGTTKVNIDGSADGHSVMVTQNVLGGGDAAAVEGSTDVNIINGAVSGSVFGGGNAAGVSENGVVDITGGTIASGVYGGSNASGAVGNTTVTLTNGTIGTEAAHANVHGGGYGKDTQVSGNVAVNIQGGTVYGDVYGGSALGTVNTNTNNTTKVKLTGGIIHGDAYGGGLGARGIAADVNGNVTVTLDGTAFVLATTTDDNGNTIPTSGRVFGCNNINGSPKGTVLVKVLKTVARDGEGNVKTKPAEKNSGIYELEAVYGGGNLAAYNPTNSKATGQYTYRFNSETYGEVNFTAVEKPVQVVIDGCGLTSIEYVYGGGNAAPTPATDVIVLGSYEIGNVFGGGNGKDRYTLDGGNTWNENPGADVGIIDAVAYQQNTANGKYGTGMSKASVLGGTVHNLFGASNTKGNVVTESLAYVDNANICDLNVGGIYGGGNEAYMDGDSKIKLGCIEALEEIYGGARNANVKGDIDLTISSGHFDRVFGGNNIGGTIDGSITVTIKETGCNPITIGELYGCGNQAPYTTPKNGHDPIINLISFTSIGNVFGGGLGASAVVTGNPTVNINVEDGDHVNVEYKGKTIDFGDDYKVTLPLHKAGEIGAIGTVYGGGNAAAVIGSTTVEMKNGIVENTLFGGGNAANVEGSTSVTILDGTIGGNVYGGGNKGDVTGATKVQIGEQPTP